MSHRTVRAAGIAPWVPWAACRAGFPSAVPWLGELGGLCLPVPSWRWQAGLPPPAQMLKLPCPMVTPPRPINPANFSNFY